MSYSYSTDEENYYGDFETEEEAAKHAFKENPDYDTVWTGLKRTFTAHDFITPINILDEIEENAADECGEAAIGWLKEISKNKSKRAELIKIIGDWIEENAPVTFWSVDDVKKFDLD